MPRLSVLIYHRVFGEPDPLQPGVVDRERFERQMRAVSRFFRVLPLSKAVKRLYDGTLPARALAITFDDGYRDNVDVALPVLQRARLPATFFIATGFLDGGCMWNDRIIEALRQSDVETVDLSAFDAGRHELSRARAERGAGIEGILRSVKHLSPGVRRAAGEHVERLAGASAPPSLMMREADVRLLRDSGMEIGAHTVSHPILACLPDGEALAEIDDSRRRLADITGDPVRLFAYPNGRPGNDYDDRHVEIVRELGFDAAMSTVWGCATATSDRLQLPRFTPWDRAAPRFIARLAAMRIRPAPREVA